MPKRGYKVASLLVITILIVLAIAGVALAAKWSDVTPDLLNGYGLTEQNLVNISDGYSDGTWRPQAAMQRQYFAKMSSKAYGLDVSNPPAVGTFIDVSTTSEFYKYIEAQYAMGMVQGTSDHIFSPENTITRQQAAAIIARYVAKVKGWDLATFKTDAEIASILENFPDAEAVYPGVKREVAFAITMGIMQGTGSGTLMIAPTRALSRIEGAALITRSLAIAQGTPSAKPDHIVLASADKQEDLIGLTEQYTFQVFDKNNAPVAGALVDFDSQQSPWYVGNVQPEAALTDASGNVTVNLISTEVGTQRVSAAIGGVSDPKKALAYGTKYWLALDEVYVRAPEPRTAQNNAGVPHTWQASVIVFGPGPLSTDQQDWYNLIKKGAVAPAKAADAIDGSEYWGKDDWYFDYVDFSQETNADEDGWADMGYYARSLPGIPVVWSIVNVKNAVADDPRTKADETVKAVPSVGQITSTGTGGTIAADKLSGVSFTDASGNVSVTIKSDAIGQTKVQAVADYQGNPYPGQLFTHWTGGPSDGSHSSDWDDQPAPYASAIKTWIAHTIGGDDASLISPSSIDANTGEEFLLTITLKDSFGNPVAGRPVEWYMQGVGQFKTDDGNTSSNQWYNEDNRDIDITDAKGTARLLVKSTERGEQIIHAKYRDKGVGGKEGPWLESVAEIQWFNVDSVTFDNPATVRDYDGDRVNEAISTNEVNGSHTFTLWVYGLKMEYYPQLPAWGTHQTAWIDSDAAQHSYDGIMDNNDAAYFGGILLVNEEELGGKYDPATGKVGGSVYTDSLTKMKLGAGGITSYDWNGDGAQESVASMDLPTGLYLPLKGKGVYVDNIALPGTDPAVPSVGSITSVATAGSIEYPIGSGITRAYPAVTNATGNATVTVKSTAKGNQWIEAVVDYPANPHSSYPLDPHKNAELTKARAHKTWTTQATPKPSLKVTIDGQEVTPGGTEGPNPVIDVNGNLASANVQVHVVDEFGNELPDYEVVYELIDRGMWDTMSGQQGTSQTYRPLTYLTDKTPDGSSKASATLTNRYKDVAGNTIITNSAANQLYREFTVNSLGTHTGAFSATTSAGSWAWQFAAQGLSPLPINPAGASTEHYVTYALWVGDYAPSGALNNMTRLADFTVGNDGSINHYTVAGSGVTMAGPLALGATTEILSSHNVVIVTAQMTTEAATMGAPIVIAGTLATTGVDDGNRYLPDNSEPRDDNGAGYQTGVGPNDGSADHDWADDLAKIVGAGGTEAYYFMRYDSRVQLSNEDVNPADWNYPGPDGAKAWTLNGLDPTKPHGSSVDIQLRENPYNNFGVTETTHVSTLLNIQVFAPKNGQVVDGTPLWAFEVKKDWKSAGVGPLTGVTLTPGGGIDNQTPTNTVGNTHTVTANLPAGADPNALFFVWAVTPWDGYSNPDPSGDEGYGLTQFSYTGSVPGTYDNITLTIYPQDPALAPAGTVEQVLWTGSVQKHWVGATVDLTPDASNNPVGTTHVMNTAVTGNADLNVAGLVYDYQVTGSNPGSYPNQGPDFSYPGNNAGADVITVSVYNNGVLIGTDTANKTWDYTGELTQISNPWWAVKNLVDPTALPVWRFDSRVGEATVTLPAGTPLVFRAYVGGTAATTLEHPKMQLRRFIDGVPTVQVFSPDSLIPDVDGYLLWTNAGHGYFGPGGPLLTSSGNRGNVAFWLDYNNNDVIDAGIEHDSAVPTYYDPWAQWLFGA